jgi:competence protein ComEC
MSFAAVLALVAAYEEIGRRRRTAPDRTRGPVAQLMRFFGGILLSTAIATAAVAPFAIYHFHTTQWYSALANMVALPVSDLLVMPAALATLVAMPFGLEAWPLAVMDVGIRVMTWTATTVAALPGSVSRVPAISQTAFVLMVIGGLWICLWGTHVRWAGFLLVAAGVALAPLTERPDVLVGRGGRLVAVRGPDGLLQALGDRSAAYDLGRWLEREGDGRPVRDALKAAAWRCDAVGCTIGAGPRVIAVSQHPAAVVDDCARAAVVVMAFRRPRACDGPALVIDAAAIEAEGAHAVRFVEGGFELATVSRARQARPWNTLATVRAISASIPARAARFAPPYSLIEPPLPNVPGIEDFTEPGPGDEP